MTSSKASCNLQTRALNVAKPLKFTIASDLDAKRQVQERIMQEVARCGYDEDDTFAIKLALEEALMNAMKHGNKLDRSKKVHIQARITPRRAEITVEDEGPGFDRRSVPDPTTEENLCKCSGRGILLIESYMNKVIWSKHGRRVKMIKLNKR
ncbi:ATP-binding protein [Fontivita pretiosa]|uniref:ATP-binding protein n=1 Tax=Fontivita pretiosa TaxID=2989684 RepID=UPI003D16D2E8